MTLKELLTAPRYGIYLPKANTTTDVAYTGYGSSFRLSMNLDLGDKDTFLKVKTALDNFIKEGKTYFDENDLAVLGVLLEGVAEGVNCIVDFGEDGITLLRLITVYARKIGFIYEKYNKFEYALQLSLTKQSCIKFAWAENGLLGDFYFNIKRTFNENVTTITGYTNFHLGNEKGAKHVMLSAGVISRKPIKVKSEEEKENGTDPEPKPIKVQHTYVRLQATDYDGITISDLVRLVTPDDIDLPEMLNNVAINDFTVLHTKDPNSKDGTKKTQLAIVLDCKIKLSEKELDTKLTIISKKEGENKHRFSFHGRVSIEEHQFDIDFSKASEGKDTSWAILASYINKGKVTIEFKKLAAALFGENDDFPDLKLDIDEPKVFFYYQKVNKASKEEGKESKGKLLIGMGAGIDLNLHSLPMAGGVFVEMNDFKFNEVLALYANSKFEKDDIKPLIKNKLLSTGFEVSKGVSVSAEVVINGKSSYYSLGGGNSSKKLPQADRNLPTADTPKPIDDSVASLASWLVIDKKIGPINLQRLGLAYHEGKVVALLDASMETKGMSLQLMGLGIGFNLDWANLDPDFYLYGLGLSYKTDTLELSGAFLRGNQEGIETYNGAARLKIKTITISAIGSYAKTKEGETSLFIYGLFEGNIGGPPIFYVTGIAAGFGYNRKVNAPELADIASYPLVALAMQPAERGLLAVLEDLEKPMSNGKLPIEIAPGNYWLALGVKFTSFKIIESFVLLTVNFGVKTEFTVLGLSRMDWPEKSLREKINLDKPIVYLELAICASFGSDSDVIKIDGMITPNSYVLSENCRLFGGFAFYTWVSGEHAGDFVLTIGGYHPRFPKPAHYPDVQRVGLLWQMSDTLILKGELYFALTPSAIMMGGRWELIFNTDIVKAHLALWIDLLIQWAPFYYDISIGILIDIEAHIPLAVCTVHLNLHFRAALQIWGPPFSGVAEIDLGIYSFEIRFGSKTLPQKKPIELKEFANGFLPKSKEKPNLKTSSDVKGYRESSPTLDCINANVTNGVIQIIEKRNGDKLYIANPMQVEIAIDSTIPVTQLRFNDADVAHTPSSELGIKPCGLSSDDVEFKMDVSLTLNDDKVTKNIKTEIINKAFPKALWGQATAGEDKNPSASQLLKDITSGINITTIAPKQHALERAYDFSKFLTPKTVNDRVAISELKKGEAFDTKDVYKTMQKYQVVSAARSAMIGALIDLDMGFDTNEDFEKLTSVETVFTDAATFFRAEPKLCRIGYNRYNPQDTK